jgi:hypothetical protein
MDYQVDEKRYESCVIRDGSGTGIFVRAMREGKWGSFDIITLDKPSLLSWLKSRGGNNEWAENAFGVLLGHGNLHD